MKCHACGEDSRLYEGYQLGYKLSGEEKMTKVSFCAVCWAEKGYQEIAKQIKAVNKHV
jgi:hypothetical protein